jgi:hypothetical protein
MNHTLLQTIHAFQMTQWCHLHSQIIFTFMLAPVATLRISAAVMWQSAWNHFTTSWNKDTERKTANLSEYIRMKKKKEASLMKANSLLDDYDDWKTKTSRGGNRHQCNTSHRTHQFKVHKINCRAEILMDKFCFLNSAFHQYMHEQPTNAPIIHTIY